MKTVQTMGFNLFSDNLSAISITEPHCKALNTMSPNSYGLSTKDSEFKNVLKKSDYLVLDGVYFALASIFLQGKNIKRNQGPDIFYHFIKRLNDENGKAFFLGSSENVLKKIKDRLNKEYPNVSVDYLSPPFKDIFSDEENMEMVSRINAFKPNVLFVGMTAPKQEKWSVKQRDKLKCSLVVSIGAVFDWYAGTQKEIHPFFFKIRVGWLVRILYRPEIFKRDMPFKMIFIKDLFLAILKIKKQS
jgi:N-acetylglucosaminyldiphosphoundecaprenol N-acetyl-beta-D-mannosaminyltransferase